MWVNHHVGNEFILNHVSRLDYEIFRKDLSSLINDAKKVCKIKSETGIQLDYDPLNFQVTLYLIYGANKKVPFKSWTDEKNIPSEDFRLAKTVRQNLNQKLDYLFQLALD